MHRIVRAVLLAGAIIAMALGSVATATPPASEHKVTICHAAPPDTAAQGWREIDVDIASSGYLRGGHQEEHDADIIPPYTYKDFSYPGKNWDAAGQAIYANGCAVPDPSAPPSDPPASDPPASDPPASDPPASDPPASTPPERSAPPVEGGPPAITPVPNIPLPPTDTAPISDTGSAISFGAILAGLALLLLARMATLPRRPQDRR
jgi:hypothetical protein